MRALDGDIHRAALASETGILHESLIGHGGVVVLDHDVAVTLCADAQVHGVLALVVDCAARAAVLGQMERTVQHDRHFRAGDGRGRVELAVRAADDLGVRQCADSLLRVLLDRGRVRKAGDRAASQRKVGAVDGALEKHHGVLPTHGLLRQKAVVRRAGRNAERTRRRNGFCVVLAGRDVAEVLLRRHSAALERAAHAVGAVEHNDEIRARDRVPRIKQMVAPALNDARDRERIHLAERPRIAVVYVVKVNRMVRQIGVCLGRDRSFRCCAGGDCAYRNGSREQRCRCQLTRSLHNFLLAWMGSGSTARAKPRRYCLLRFPHSPGQCRFPTYANFLQYYIILFPTWQVKL